MKALVNLIFKISCLVRCKVAAYNLMRIGIGHAKNQTTPSFISHSNHISQYTMPTIFRVGLLTSSKRVVMLCLLELHVVFSLTEFL